MRYLVTGSSGHLGEAIARVLKAQKANFATIDVIPGPFTQAVGSITDSAFVNSQMGGVDAVLHAATLHKPHVVTHSRQDFIDTNITGTSNLLEAARLQGVSAFVFTSTTSAFGDALTPPPDARAAWITEDVAPISKNIYGATKLAAEDLCWLAHRKDGLPVIILRTSRFFPEEADDAASRAAFSQPNLQTNEFLHRRVDIEDVVDAHLLAAQKAAQLGFERYIISATTPFTQNGLAELRSNCPAVLRRSIDFEPGYRRLGWRMYPDISRVYVNTRARETLGWRPKHDFRSVLARVAAGGRPLSPLAYAVGAKVYHDQVFEGAPYPVE